VFVCLVVSRHGERSVCAVMSNCTTAVLWGEFSGHLCHVSWTVGTADTRRPTAPWLRVGKRL
jgi:hypothetical protein